MDKKPVKVSRSYTKKDLGEIKNPDGTGTGEHPFSWEEVNDATFILSKNDKLKLHFDENGIPCSAGGAASLKKGKSSVSISYEHNCDWDRDEFVLTVNGKKYKTNHGESEQQNRIFEVSSKTRDALHDALKDGWLSEKEALALDALRDAIGTSLKNGNISKLEAQNISNLAKAVSAVTKS